MVKHSSNLVFVLRVALQTVSLYSRNISRMTLSGWGTEQANTKPTLGFQGACMRYSTGGHPQCYKAFKESNCTIIGVINTLNFDTLKTL